jgi:hypothetical protein
MSLGSLVASTFQQPVKKLSQISDCVIIGTSGPVGLGQRFRGVMEDIWESKKLSGKKTHEAMLLLRTAFWAQAEPEFNVAKSAVQLLGQKALEGALSYTLVALPLNKEPCLIQFDHQCAPEIATRHLPFIAIGSGQALADTFLAFLRRIFWSDRAPRITDGVLATIWSLGQAIRTNPGGVGNPIQIMTLQKTNGGMKVTELGEPDFEEHRQAITAAEESLRNFRDSLGPSANSSVSQGSPPVPR